MCVCMCVCVCVFISLCSQGTEKVCAVMKLMTCARIDLHDHVPGFHHPLALHDISFYKPNIIIGVVAGDVAGIRLGG